MWSGTVDLGEWLSRVPEPVLSRKPGRRSDGGPCITPSDRALSTPRIGRASSD